MRNTKPPDRIELKVFSSRFGIRYYFLQVIERSLAQFLVYDCRYGTGAMGPCISALIQKMGRFGFQKTQEGCVLPKYRFITSRRNECAVMRGQHLQQCSTLLVVGWFVCHVACYLSIRVLS